MTDPDRDALVMQICLHEGVRSKPYRDSEGFLTVAIGYNLDARGYEPLSETLGFPVTLDYLRLNGLDRDQCLAQCNADIDACIRDLTTFPWFIDLDPVRQRVVVDLRYALGPGKFRGFKKMRAALMQDDYERAADEIANSLFYEQTKSRGVRLVRWMRTGVAA